jgi:hypothetical protein
MNRADLESLRAPREYPAVSVLSPLQRRRPGNAKDAIRLRHLAERARRRLHDELGVRDSEAVVQHLEDGIAAVDLAHPTDGVAVFATATETHVLPLPFTVPERVVVNHAFEIRDLTRGLARRPRYRLLALGLKPARLLEADGDDLVEVTDHGFPMFIEGARGEAIDSGGYAPRSSRTEPQLEQFFRRVDAGLGAIAAGHPLPVVLVGTERDLAHFARVTEHRDWLIGEVNGNHERTPADELARLAAPVVAADLAQREAAAVVELVEAIGAARAVVGIKPVWERASEGRGRTLFVEEDFEYPARIVDGRLEPAADADAPEVIDDAVDALVDIVLETGGDVVFLEPGALDAHGPVAMLLRY